MYEHHLLGWIYKQWGGGERKKDMHTEKDTIPNQIILPRHFSNFESEHNYKGRKNIHGGVLLGFILGGRETGNKKKMCLQFPKCANVDHILDATIFFFIALVI